MIWDQLNRDIAFDPRHYVTKADTRKLSLRGRLNHLLTTAFSTFVFATASASVHAETPDIDNSGSIVTGAVQPGEPVSPDSSVLKFDAVSIQDAAGQNQEPATNATVDKLSGVLEQAEMMIGIRYAWGGNNPDEGLDCSGFVRYVYEKATGISLPRLSAQISRKGKPIAQTDLHPGDLVFFNTPRGAATHVGIYVGEHQFIHAPKTGAFIRIESMKSAYWTSRYYGARRMAA